MQIERRGTESKIKQLGSRSDEYLTVTSISLHHQNQEILLASYLNGEIKMFHEKYGENLNISSITLICTLTTTIRLFSDAHQDLEHRPGQPESEPNLLD